MSSCMSSTAHNSASIALINRLRENSKRQRAKIDPESRRRMSSDQRLDYCAICFFPHHHHRIPDVHCLSRRRYICVCARVRRGLIELSLYRRRLGAADALISRRWAVEWSTRGENCLWEPPRRRLMNADRSPMCIPLDRSAEGERGKDGYRNPKTER
uniref:Uncharacterized protein n=1 Tax=Plectus sambesii TaxID=2011161 RepID=A0A914XJX9_9BILA